MQREEERALKRNHLLAVVATPQAAESIVATLQQQSNEATVLSLESFSEAVGEHAGPLGHLLRLFQDHLSEEMNIVSQYLDETRAGRGVLAVHLDQRDEAASLVRELTAQGAFNVRLFTTLSVIDLTPESNPQAFAATEAIRRENRSE